MFGMFLVRMLFLIVALAISCGLCQKANSSIGLKNQNNCNYACDDKTPTCGYNGRCKFRFNSKCDLGYYNCQYTTKSNRISIINDDVCKNHHYSTCAVFYDTSKHTYFPMPRLL